MKRVKRVVDDYELPEYGDVEFLIHARCEGCGWRCAVPGEAMTWPTCPNCDSDEPVKPWRPDAHFEVDYIPPVAGYIGVFLPEQQALEVIGRKRRLEVILESVSEIKCED